MNMNWDELLSHILDMNADTLFWVLPGAIALVLLLLLVLNIKRRLGLGFMAAGAMIGGALLLAFGGFADFIFGMFPAEYQEMLKPVLSDFGKETMIAGAIAFGVGIIFIILAVVVKKARAKKAAAETVEKIQIQ